MGNIESLLLRGRAEPLLFAKVLWPKVSFYDCQVAMIESVRDNDETFVVAGNMLGKDFTAAFIALWAFLVWNPVRVVTTSVKDDHLRVLWGEIGRFIKDSAIPLRVEDGGPLIVNHREIRKVVKGSRDDISYCIGMVSERGEGMAGHHATHTLGVIDEASGIDNTTYQQMATWAKRILAFGNANPPLGGFDNFFYKAVKGGDIVAA